MAMITGQRMIRSGLYKHVVICGADLVSDFVSSGFKSFLALSDGHCKPFDANRNGINLGEAAATVILTNDEKLLQQSESVLLAEGAGSNDANHISGPSRTGEELSLAINKALKKSNVQPDEIGFISAHGTATLYNDEMEAKAFHLSNLSHTSVNSLKGNFGHTLGAAGLLETIISTEALKQDLILPTLGYQVSGVSVPLKVNIEPEHRKVQHFIKTASGFGGCNAAMLFSKQN
jgi:3-oxoacyl-[acyl-carrier-protein] synthase-1